MAQQDAVLDYANGRIQAAISERYSWFSHWRDCADYTAPRRYKWLITPNQANRGSAQNGRIIDNTPTIAVRNCASGFMAGVTSPTRPWFKMKIGRTESDGTSPTAVWLYQVERMMMRVFQESNFYTAMATAYYDLVIFGSACIVIYEDFENVIQCYNPCAGEFFFMNNYKMFADSTGREFTLTVDQVVNQFGKDKVSDTVRTAYDEPNGSGRSREIIIRHLIEPAKSWPMPNKKFKFMEVYWERGTAASRPLKTQGFYEQPAMNMRWDLVSNDAYGRSPVMEALGDIKSLQMEQVRKAQAIDKMVNPPLIGDIQLQNQPASGLPGGITYIAGQNNIGLKPIYTVMPPVQEIMMDIKETQERIKSTLFNDLFLMISQLDTVRTATEIDSRKEEKFVMLGPVLERLQNEGLSVAIERTFAIMLRGGLLPPAPPEIQGHPIEITYVSMLAEAQRAAQTSGMERLAQTVGQMAAIDPQVLDKIDFDEYIDEYSEALGNSPKLLRDAKAVKALRDARAKAQQQQQAMEATPGLAQAGKNLAQTDVGGGQNALQKMLGG